MGLSCYFWKHSLIMLGYYSTKFFEAFRRQEGKLENTKNQLYLIESLFLTPVARTLSTPFSQALEYTPSTAGWDLAQDKSYSLFLQLTLRLSAWHLFIILASSAKDGGKSKETWEVVLAKWMCRQKWALLIKETFDSSDCVKPRTVWASPR